MKKIICFILTLVLTLSLCACGAPAEDAPAGEEVTLTDMVGRQITVRPGSYERVVCIGAGALRMYCYVGDTALLCGVEDIDNLTLSQRPQMFDSVARPYVLAYGDVFSTLPSCGVGGPMAQTAEAEKILSCNPDIILSEYEDAEKADALQQQLGVPVVTLKAGSQGVFDPAFADSMTLLGKVFGREEKAAQLNAFVASQRAEIEAVVASIDEQAKPSVYICGLGNWGTTDHLMTAENFISFQVAGVRNVVSGLENKGVGAIEAEKFVSLGSQMDIMIIDAAAIKNIAPAYAKDPTMFDTCKAWQEGQVYLELAYNAYYTNFELHLLNTWYIAKVVYPEAFAQVDMTEKADQITQAFLGMELAEELFAYQTYRQITADFFE